ncbi:hypothetical protein BV22DRAFT_1127685 [Leucogyrophana mollusca]|uniref:Uncharacterized protein n=1 Tax=Leucogyrophana mollusca TaxID=85980 RepID=A0ACB8BQJ6_9AGAM|nr:hypothetical protein BV22DRAFT_1127685 [Leucogyrophana mollusca]
MSTHNIAMDNTILAHLERWQQQRIKDELPLVKAVQSLDTDSPLIYLHADDRYKTSWTIHDQRTKKAALFCHATRWQWSSNLKTGNYVPPRELPPPGLPPSRIRSIPSTNQCSFTFCFNTDNDESFFDHQKALETFAKQTKGFNKDERPRRDWQNGAGDQTRFLMTWNMFERKNPFNSNWADNIKFDLHPWIQDAIKSRPYFVPNIHRPSLFTLDDNVLTDITDSDSVHFNRGDVVWVSFTLKYIVGSDWAPLYTPVDLVRVYSVPAVDDTDESTSTSHPVNRRLSAGEVILPALDTDDGMNIDEAASSSQVGTEGLKRKIEDDHNTTGTLTDSDNSPPPPVTRRTGKRRAF